jgi:hypothetical protein
MGVSRLKPQDVGLRFGSEPLGLVFSYICPWSVGGRFVDVAWTVVACGRSASMAGSLAWFLARYSPGERSARVAPWKPAKRAPSEYLSGTAGDATLTKARLRPRPPPKCRHTNICPERPRATLARVPGYTPPSARCARGAPLVESRPMTPSPAQTVCARACATRAFGFRARGSTSRATPRPCA